MAVELDRPSVVMDVQKPVVYGVGVLVVNSEGGILVAEQKLNKSLTGREAGQQSIPLETSKVIRGFEDRVLEPNESGLLGAMAEVTNDSTLNNVGSAFHVLPSENYLGSQVHPGVFARIETVVYTGDTLAPFVSAHPDEIGEVSWVNPYDYVAWDDSRARPLAKEVVLFALNKGLIENAHFEHDLGNSHELFAPGFSIDQAHQERERHPDINKVYTT